jgi:chromatin assembly factor 1 subunit B
MVFAVASRESVLVYSTESYIPICAANNIHYASITDLAWCNDKSLIISSSDGFCSAIKFEPKQFGERYDINLLPEKMKHLFDKYDSINIANMQSHEATLNTKSTILKSAKNKEVKLEVLNKVEEQKQAN